MTHGPALVTPRVQTNRMDLVRHGACVGDDPLSGSGESFGCGDVSLSIEAALLEAALLPLLPSLMASLLTSMLSTASTGQVVALPSAIFKWIPGTQFQLSRMCSEYCAVIKEGKAAMDGTSKKRNQCAQCFDGCLAELYCCCVPGFVGFCVAYPLFLVGWLPGSVTREGGGGGV